MGKKKDNTVTVSNKKPRVLVHFGSPAGVEYTPADEQE